ncbi:hypothetical protein UY3_03485 [Chelonia mydas]|uniref:Uncharacterized protein n=1 Tax=Chelonia mydas TaxID=8469 RepID=M7CER8_CHEMY|nr:hypothetical protein UY3_03485 [Chelonia mydas]
MERGLQKHRGRLPLLLPIAVRFSLRRRERICLSSLTGPDSPLVEVSSAPTGFRGVTRVSGSGGSGLLRVVYTWNSTVAQLQLGCFSVDTPYANRRSSPFGIHTPPPREAVARSIEEFFR